MSASPRVVVVTGSRDWECFGLAVRILSDLVVRTPEGFALHHGDARGVDRSFRDAGRTMRLPIVPHPADWNRLGKKAGPIRNSEMIDLGPDVVIACHPNLEGGGGTFDCVGKALAAGIPVYHFRAEDHPPLLVKSLSRGKIEYQPEPVEIRF